MKSDTSNPTQPIAGVKPNWRILGGCLAFLAVTLVLGLNQVPYNQEIVFIGSMVIVVWLMNGLLQELPMLSRRKLVGTAIVIFVFRAVPGPGSGASWWQIDSLGFDQEFLALLSLIGSSFALLGMMLFRCFMAERSILYVVGFLTIFGILLNLPTIGLFYGLHEWT